jgi:superoxide dismutase
MYAPGASCTAVHSSMHAQAAPREVHPLQDLVPILGIDAWEHAYYLQYKNVKADYFKAIWNVVNWQDVSSRYQQALKGDAGKETIPG